MTTTNNTDTQKTFKLSYEEKVVTKRTEEEIKLPLYLKRRECDSTTYLRIATDEMMTEIVMDTNGEFDISTMKLMSYNTTNPLCGFNEMSSKEEFDAVLVGLIVDLMPDDAGASVFKERAPDIKI